MTLSLEETQSDSINHSRYILLKQGLGAGRKYLLKQGEAGVLGRSVGEDGRVPMQQRDPGSSRTQQQVQQTTGYCSNGDIEPARRQTRSLCLGLFVLGETAL